MPPTIFLSYSRRDDEPFVQQLYTDLIAHGFEVWWDRVSMPSRGLTFLQEIRDAVDARDRLLLVVGPSANSSDYVVAEWKHALNFAKAVTPVLRIGSAPNPEETVPAELRLLNIEDFRNDADYPERLRQLVLKLKEKPAPAGKLIGVPNLPEHLIARSASVQRLREAVIADTQRPVAITGAATRLGVHGMGGIGKSVMANLLARDMEVRKAFPDGIIWVPIGKSPNVIQLQLNVLSYFSDEKFSFDNSTKGQEKLRTTLAGKKILLLLDDVWEASHARAFDCLDVQGRLLFTTRDAALLSGIQGGTEYRVELLSETEALELVALRMGTTAEALPPAAREVIRRCGRLPLALTLSTALALQYGWDGVLKRLEKASLKYVRDLKNALCEQHQSLWTALNASAEALTAEELQCFKELCVFPQTVRIPEAAIQRLWQRHGALNELDAEDILTKLAQRSLVDLESLTEGESKLRSMRMHDLLKDFARELHGDATPLHRELVEAYRQAAPQGWEYLPEDGYSFSQLPWHLSQAGMADELRALHFSAPWLRAKLKHCGIQPLIRDTQLLPTDNDRDFHYLRRALELSAHVLGRNPEQLPGQLTGRLIGLPGDGIAKLLAELRIPLDGKPLLLTAQPGSHVTADSPMLRTFEGHMSGVNAVAFSPDGNTAISGSHGSTLRLWEVATGTTLRTLDGHKRAVNSVVFSPDGKSALSGSDDDTLRLWNVDTGETIRTFAGHTDSVGVVVFSPDGKNALSGSDDNTLRLWNVDTGETIRTFEGHMYGVLAVAFSSDGKTALSGSVDNTLRLWEVATGTTLRIYKGHSDKVKAVAFSPDGQTALSGSWDTTLRLWDVAIGETIRTFNGYSGSVQAVAFSPNGKTALSGSMDNTLRLWEVATGTTLRTYKGHSDEVKAVAFSPNGQTALSGSWDATLRHWDIAIGEPIRTFNGYSGSVPTVAFSPDCKTALCCSVDNTLRLWKVATGETIRTFAGHRDSVGAVVFSPDGKNALSGSDDNTLRLWDVANGTTLRTFEGHRDSVGVVVFSPDGKTALSDIDGRTLRLWDVATGETIRRFKGHTDWVRAAAFSPDGKTALSASWDKTLRLWDIDTGTTLRIFVGHRGWALSVAFSPCGKTTLSCSWDRTLRLWNVATGETIRTFTGHKSPVESVAFSPAGRTALSGSRDKTLRLWDIESGECLSVLETDYPISSFAVSKERIVVGNSGGYVHQAEIIEP